MRAPKTRIFGSLKEPTKNSAKGPPGQQLSAPGPPPHSKLEPKGRQRDFETAPWAMGPYGLWRPAPWTNENVHGKVMNACMNTYMTSG